MINTANAINEQHLEEALAKIEKARNWSPRVISKLENHVRTADDADLFRLNPLKWAQDKSVDEHEAVDLFLHAAKAGLFVMDWNVVCRCCGMIMRSFRNLHGLKAQNTCSVCFRKAQVTLDDYVQVTFSLSPSVRPLRYHHPETLTLEDFIYNYQFERSGRWNFPQGAMTLAEFFAHVQLYVGEVSPGEKITISAPVKQGGLYVIDMYSLKGFVFYISDAPEPVDNQVVTIKQEDWGFDVPLPQIVPGEIKVGEKLHSGIVYPLSTGNVTLELENVSASKAGLIVYYAELESIKVFPDLEFLPCLTAKRLFNSNTFHELFRAEVFQESEGFGVKDVTFLFTDLKSSTQLYQQIGDLNAFSLVRQHYGVLNTAVVSNHGVVVKTIGDAVMATFEHPAEAVSAGLEMLRELRQLNTASHNEPLVLKIGAHKGAAISVTLNERIDYFGQTVNIAARVQSTAGGDEIYLTEEIYNADGVAELLQKHNCIIDSMLIELKGIEELVRIHKVTS